MFDCTCGSLTRSPDQRPQDYDAEEPEVWKRKWPFRRERQEASSALDLLEPARRELDAARSEASARARYVSAYRAAADAAAVVIAVRGCVPASGRESRSAWELLPQVDPALSEWAVLFAAGEGKRAAAEAGLSRAVSPRDAHDLLREAAAFMATAERVIGCRTAQAASR
jgi:SAV_6107-like HEPN